MHEALLHTSASHVLATSNAANATAADQRHAVPLSVRVTHCSIKLYNIQYLLWRCKGSKQACDDAGRGGG